MKKKYTKQTPGSIRFIVICLLLAAHCSLLTVNISALDFLLRPKGFVFLPMGEGNVTSGGTPRYDIGGGADVGFELDLSSIWPNPWTVGYSAGLEGGMATNPLMTETSQNILFYSLGASLGLYYFPLSRLFIRLDGAAGLYTASLGSLLSPYGLYYRGGGEIGFRFTPSFLISANAGWKQYSNPRDSSRPFNSGLYAGLTAQITLQFAGETGRNGAEGTLIQTDPIYPAFLQLYQTNPVGSIRIRNLENAEIRNVRLSFRAANYTQSEFFCGSVAVIPRGGAVELPLLADFSPAVLRFTDTGRILGEVIIRYNFLGQEREAVSAVTVTSNSRNTITENDTMALAAFVSPTSPEVLEYSRFVIGLARSSRRTGHNQNMQYAIWLFEALRALGVRIDETHNLDNEVQFPAETLLFGRGSSRDIALLFATALESVGIPSAFIRIGTDFIVAIDLGMTHAAAETMFYDQNRILVIDNSVWLPIAMSSFEDGFMASWTRGVVSLNLAFDRGDFVEFVMASEAWAIYPPAPLPELGNRARLSNSAAVMDEVNRAMEHYIAQDIMPILWGVETQISMEPTASLYNRLGILSARAGRIDDSKLYYEIAADMGLIAGMTNRGSLALNERDYDTAEYWYLRVLSIDSQNANALRGLERVEGRR